MRLATILTPQVPRVAAVTARRLRRSARHRPRPADVREAPARRLARGAQGRGGSRRVAQDAVKYAANAVKLLPPVPNPSQDPLHRPELPRPRHRRRNRPIPPEPVLFGKFPNTLIAHGDADHAAEGGARRSITRRSWSSSSASAAGTSRTTSRRSTTSAATPAATTSPPATGSSAARRSSGSSARRSTPSPRPARCS